MTESDEPKSVGTIEEAAAACLRNAEALYDEAKILANAGAFSRALFLHQISIEECAKVQELGASSMVEFVGGKIDWQRLSRRMSSHKAKNLVNAFMLPETEAEQKAHATDDPLAAGRAFKEMQSAFHETSNTNKNAALYVNFNDKGAVSVPWDSITEIMAAEAAERNESFLAIAHHHVHLVTANAAHPELAQRKAMAIRDRLLPLAKGDSPPTKEALLDAILDIADSLDPNSRKPR